MFVDRAEYLIPQFLALRKNNSIFSVFTAPESPNLNLFAFIFTDLSFFFSLLED